MRKLPLFALSALVLSAAAAGAVSPHSVSELFPAEPGVNAQRGYAVAVDGDWLAMGAHRDDENGKDAGAVYLFHWSGTTWEQKKKLLAQTPLPGAQLGFSLALCDGLLAAGAPGEGAVYLFALQEKDDWALVRTFTGPAHAFGRSLALDGNHLAVGAVGGHGVADGSVYLYLRLKDDSWGLQQKLQPAVRQEGERFGTAVSLADDVLVAGAPGYEAGAGAVHVFRLEENHWGEEAKLLSPDSPPMAGDQFGAAVATDGTEIFAGAPTADPADKENSGAVYRFVQGAGGWFPQGLPVEDPVPGEQLGTSLALSGNLLVAGAPAPPPGTGSGSVHVLRRFGTSWHAVRSPAARNSESRDLVGFAVAVNGERVVVGGVLGDQGYGAAGATWSFRCPEEKECAEEAEAVARGGLSGRRFGVSVALTEELMAVGAPESDTSLTGAVYLYRRTGDEWRQEERLTSAWRGDGFGSSVALEGSLLAVGAPLRRTASSGEPPTGNVDLFVRRGASWFFKATLPTSCGETAGTSVAISDGAVAVGAPGCQMVYLFEKVGEDWSEVKVSVLKAPAEAEGFGFAVSLRGGVLAIGAPEANNGAGKMFVSVREGQEWTDPRITAAAVRDNPLRLGSSVAVGGGLLAVGAPGFRGGGGAVFLCTIEGCGARLSALAPRRFGSSVAMLGNRLVVGGPGEDTATVYEPNRAGDWVVVADLGTLPHGNEFGAAVALSEDLIVVTSPGPSRGDRVTTFKLPLLKGGDQ